MTRQEDDVAAKAVRVVTQRLDFLDRLSESALSKRELVDELPYSRSTVDRAIRDLQTTGLIEQTDDGYVATLCGRVSADQYRRFVQTARDAVAVEDVVAGVPADAPVDGRAFRGSTVHRSDDAAPYDLVDRLVESLDGVDRLRALSDGYPHPQYFDAVVDRVERGRLTVDVIVSRSLWRAFVDHYPEQVDTMSDVGIDVRVGEVPPFTLHLLDDGDGTTVQLLVHTDTGAVRGVVTNDTADAVEWATDLFERVSDGANPPGDVDEN